MNKDLSTLHSELKAHEDRLHNLVELQNSLPNWDSLLETSSTERKKVMLSYLIDKIFVYKDRIDIELHDYIKILLSVIQ